MKVLIVEDEKYPFYRIGTAGYYDFEVELSKEEFDDFKRVLKELNDWFGKIETLKPHV